MFTRVPLFIAPEFFETIVIAIPSRWQARNGENVQEICFADLTGDSK